MSLQVWLPLTKDLRNQGLSDVTVTNNGATFNSVGKLGGCYEFASGKRIQTTLPSTSNLNSKAISFACWVNISSWNSSYDCLMSIADGTSWYQSRATLCRNNTTSTLCWNIADGSTSTRAYTTTNLSINTWYHIACTYDGANLKIYVNGVLDNSTAAALSIRYAGTFNIGGWSGNNYPINCKMNDIRIYSHCLSPMEVKELAKGLVLHYPLNRQGWGQENLLLTNSNPITTSLTGWGANGGSNFVLSNVSSSSASGGRAIRVTYTGTSKIPGGIYKLLGTDPMTLESGANYTVSARLRASKNCQLTLYNETMSGFADINVTTKWKTFSYTAPVNYGGTYSANIIGIPSTQVSQNMWVECDWTKFEKGDKATPWCPNASESLYTLLGLNGTIEYDCSGFCNNGTRTGTFSWTSDTPKYSVSTQFNGTQYIRLPFSCGIISEAVSVAVWGYESNWNTSSAERLIGAATGSSGWCIGDYGSENTLFAFYANGGYNTAIGFKQLSAGWHHFVITFDGLHLNYYVDGQPFSSKTFSTKQVATGNYNIEIGRHYGGGCNFKGSMSDVRIYATALSADDVLSLYQNSAYIDSSGNVYGAVHSEV